MKFNFNLLFKPENLVIGLLLFGTGFVAGKYLLNRFHITSSVLPSQVIPSTSPVITATNPPSMREYSHAETPISYAMIQDEVDVVNDIPSDSTLDDYDNSIVENYY